MGYVVIGDVFRWFGAFFGVRGPPEGGPRTRVLIENNLSTGVKVLLSRVHAARRCPDKPAKAQASSVMARANKVSQELLHMRSLSRQSTTDLCAMQAGWI